MKINNIEGKAKYRTFNPLVERSNRSRPTIYKEAFRDEGLFYDINLSISCKFHPVN